ncbi:serine/threonine-protein kinase KIPK2-like [Galendromus occidentalis]|uniref:Serine/threonine-protein kinase greatwall n=1 Tax=Galendromus occidentalis TaxID=34638 RepID=A0AAJ7SHW3_9ACAR|nr:serine/threonine-protein kinase KIPK2-like [Galendromus occidentalis]
MESLKPTDTLAAQTLTLDLEMIVQICNTMMEYYETYENLRPTSWTLVMDLLKPELKPREEVYYPQGKFKYFSVSSLLGVGGFGAVYKAYFGNILCCLKFVPPHMMPSMKHALADKQVASMINHPCLVKYFTTFMTNDAFVTCMEYIQGTDLTKLLKEAGYGLPSGLVRLIASQLGLAVQHLHFKGFIHRDIKPDNIMILCGGRIKLIDFDTCKVSMGKYSRKYMPTFNEKTGFEFSTSEVAGTLNYMPPEAFHETGLGRSTDWWAIGVVTYEIATGSQPFRGFTEEQVRPQIVRARYSWPATRYWNQYLVQFVADCLTVDPTARLCSARYSDFQSHPYFDGIDFHSVETAPVLYDFPLIDEVIGRTPAHLTDGIVYNSPQSECKRLRLFPQMDFQDLEDQDGIYCYSSPGFIRCIEAYCRNEVPTYEDIYEDQEFLDVEDDYSVPYVFVNLLAESKADSKRPSIALSPEDALSGKPAVITKKFGSFVKKTIVKDKGPKLSRAAARTSRAAKKLSPPTSDRQEQLRKLKTVEGATILIVPE